MLFQISDDLIDHEGNSKIAGKKTGKDQKKGKATLISLLGYDSAVKYSKDLIINIDKKISKNTVLIQKNKIHFGIYFK